MENFSFSLTGTKAIAIYGGLGVGIYVVVKLVNKYTRVEKTAE